MKRRISIFLFFVATLATSQLFASWSSVPRDQMVSAAHFVATGRVVKISSEDKSETITAGKRKYTHHYRLAYIEIDSILKNDLVGTGLKVGGTVVIRMAPKKPRYPNSFSFKEGDSGIWLLSYANGSLGTPRPDCLMPIAELASVKRIITELDARYKKALLKDIPVEEAKRNEILVRRPLTQKEIDAAIAKGIPRGVDIESLRAVKTHRKPLDTLLVDQQGNVVGGIPYHARRSQFSDGLLPVSMAVEKSIYRKHNFVDRNGKLLLKESCASAQGFSEGLAAIYRNNKGGYIDTSGKLVIPCTYDLAAPFSNGIARVTRGKNAFLIDKTGKVVREGRSNQILSWKSGLGRVNFNGQTIGYIDNTGKLVLDTKEKTYIADRPFIGGLSKVWMRRTKPRHHGFIDRTGVLAFPSKPWIFGDCSEGLIPFAKDWGRSSKWGYLDKAGKVVISPRFIQAGGFSDGVAVVTHITWKKRPEVVGKDKSVRLSPQAATHFLSSLDGYINRKGEIISPIGFSSCHQFAKGLARVRIYFGRGIFDGLINKEGKAVLVLSNSIGK